MRKLTSLLFICLLLSQIYTQELWCTGQRCEGSCDNCNLCNEDNCQLPDCKCPSTDIPGGLDVNDTPQFVFISFDDSVPARFWNDLDLEHSLFRNENLKDALGCYIKPTFYVMSDLTDWPTVKQIHDLGAIFGLHSVTHTTNHWSPYETFQYELATNYDDLIYSGQVESVKLARAPFLSYNNYYFQVLESLGIEVDSSLSASPGCYNGEISPRHWPYTMHYGFPNQWSCYPETQECPNQAYHLWQFPMRAILDTSNCNVLYDMDPPVTEENYQYQKDQFLENFRRNYETNRAPFGLHVHYFWFYTNDQVDPIRMQFLQEVYQEMLSYANVIFANELQIVDFIKSPQPYADYIQNYYCDAQYAENNAQAEQQEEQANPEEGAEAEAEAEEEEEEYWNDDEVYYEDQENYYYYEDYEDRDGYSTGSN